MPTLTFDADTSPAEHAMAGLTSVLQTELDAACQQTAEAIAQEASARLGRQIKGTSIASQKRSDLGENLTVGNIHAQPAYDGDGWVVLSDRNPFPNVPLYLEKGTRAGRRHNFARTPPEAYFYPSIQLEAPNHESRVETAMQNAAAQTGLGGS